MLEFFNLDISLMHCKQSYYGLYFVRFHKIICNQNNVIFFVIGKTGILLNNILVSVFNLQASLF